MTCPRQEACHKWGTERERMQLAQRRGHYGNDSRESEKEIEKRERERECLLQRQTEGEGRREIKDINGGE